MVTGYWRMARTQVLSAASLILWDIASQEAEGLVGSWTQVVSVLIPAEVVGQCDSQLLVAGHSV